MQTLSWKTLVTWKSWSLWTESARKSKQTGHKPFPCAFVWLIHLMVHSLAVAGWKVRGVCKSLEDCGLRGDTTRSLNSREENKMEKRSLYPLTVLQWYKWKIHVHPKCSHRFMVWNGMPCWPTSMHGAVIHSQGCPEGHRQHASPSDALVALFLCFSLMAVSRTTGKP